MFKYYFGGKEADDAVHLLTFSFIKGQGDFEILFDSYSDPVFFSSSSFFYAL